MVRIGRLPRLLPALLAFAVGYIVISNAHAQPAFSNLGINPTGEPIGGGVGYSDVYAGADADFVVGTKAELLDALGRATSGQIIFVSDGAEIDLSGERNLVIPGGVTLAGGRGRNGSSGALIYSTSFFNESDYAAVFVTGGAGVRITGLRFRGPSAEILDHDFDATGVANAVRALHSGLKVDNNEFFAWDKWAVWLYVSDQAHIHHNYIHHNRRNGYGYGVWVGGSGTETGAYTLIEANLFDYNRHHVASSAHDNTWEARYNVAMEHGLQQAFDRHTNSAGGGGRSTLVHRNWFKNIDTRAFSSPGYPSEAFRIYENWFAHNSQDRAISIKPDVTNAFIYDNAYGGVDASLLPAAVAGASVTEGTAPLKVNFDASGSVDPSGAAIVRYTWDFADGRDVFDGRAEGASATYTFEEPGLYQVELKVYNEYGVPGRSFVPVLVKPAVSAYVLSAWLKDTYIGERSGHYRKQVLIDNQVVWEDDVAGNEGWQHIVADISDLAAGKASVEVGVRILVDAPITDPLNQIAEIHLYADDVHLFGGSVENGMFEPAGGWRYTANGNWSSGYESEDVRSGDLAFRLRNPFMRLKTTGEFATIYQAVPLSEIELSAEPAPTTVTQQIGLESGWNMVSLNVAPADPSIESVLSGILPGLRIAEDAFGDVFDPQENVNTIGEWSSSEAYMINVEAATELTVEGLLIDPQSYSLSLAEGWNFLPYLRTSPASVQDALASIHSDVVLLKDEAGGIYYPEYGIDNIGQLQPGHGYRIYVRSPVSLTYPAN